MNELKINWDLIVSKFKYAAMDANGDIYLFTTEPYIFANYWDSKDYLKFFKKYDGETDWWKTSLIKRI